MRTLLGVAKEIQDRVPSHYQDDLEDRLVLIWGEIVKQTTAGQSRRRQAEYLKAYREKHARRCYLHVQDSNYLLLLPFVLAHSIRACADYKITELPQIGAQTSLEEGQFRLNVEVKMFLEQIALKRGLCRNSNYLKFMTKMFPAGRPDLGTVDDTTETRQRLISRQSEHHSSEAVTGSLLERGHTIEPDNSDWQEGRGDRQIQYMFSKGPCVQMAHLGQEIEEAIQTSNQWKAERMRGDSTTDCLTTLIPEGENEDISITLWVGRRAGLQLLDLFKLERTWSAAPSYR